MRVPCSQREEHKPAQPSRCRAHPLWSKLASLHTQGRTHIPRQLDHGIHAAHRQVSLSMDTRTKAALSHFTVYQGLPFPAVHAGGLKLIYVQENPGQTSEAASDGQVFVLLLERSWLAGKQLQCWGFFFSPGMCGIHKCIFQLDDTPGTGDMVYDPTLGIVKYVHSLGMC